MADLPSAITVQRPFYPLSSKKGVSRAELVAGLGVTGFDDLLRVCDRRTEHRQAACSIFWILGGNQVGKAAITGWREIVRPALKRGAKLWPFDGHLAELTNARGVVIAETYPAEAYHMVGADFRPFESKRRQADRAGTAIAILSWADRHGIVFTPFARSALVDGFGAAARGEDQFDAVLGLLKMIEVTEGRRSERTEPSDETAKWEGWILAR